MKYGFIKVAAASPALRVADCRYNAERTAEMMQQAAAAGAHLLVLPELGLTSYTCGDLLLQPTLQQGALTALQTLLSVSAELPLTTITGLPLSVEGKLYNCAAAVQNGKLLGLVPKSYLPNYSEFYEARHFEPADRNAECICISFAGFTVFFGTNQLFCHKGMKDLIIGAEICEDVWGQLPPSVSHCMAGATVIVNLSASPESIGKPEYRRELVGIHSARNICGYVYSNSGEGESTTDLVYSGHSVICENGAFLAERMPFEKKDVIYTELDVKRLVHERRRITDFKVSFNSSYKYIYFDGGMCDTDLTRSFSKRPFVPEDEKSLAGRCRFILDMQSSALAKRLRHAGCRTAVIGISGGLDSTLALLVTASAMDKLGKSRDDIVTVTMPCFGTGKRTRGNAEKLCEYLNTRFVCIDIADAVKIHLRDIDHPDDVYDVTYENAQARERTQVLMDMANKTGGIVIGTGDLSEMALGWSTYNGDHMSMYGVNCSVPKTLVRYLVSYYAEYCADKRLASVLRDVLDTPVSPELIPAAHGEELGQRTEDILGTYELHDFFLYYFVRFGYSPAKILRIAKTAFAGTYETDYIESTLRTFIKRFFIQQFKRSCTPDGVKVGSVTLSPRGDWRMPSDACFGDFISEIE